MYLIGPPSLYFGTTLILKLQFLKEYDLMMNKLRLTKSPTYAEEVAIQNEKEEYQSSKEAVAR